MLYKAKNNNANWREKVWNFLKLYNTDFVFGKDIPVELDLSFGNDIEPNNLKEIFLLQSVIL